MTQCGQARGDADWWGHPPVSVPQLLLVAEQEAVRGGMGGTATGQEWTPCSLDPGSWAGIGHLTGSRQGLSWALRTPTPAPLRLPFHLRVCVKPWAQLCHPGLDSATLGSALPPRVLPLASHLVWPRVREPLTWGGRSSLLGNGSWSVRLPKGPLPGAFLPPVLRGASASLGHSCCCRLCAGGSPAEVAVVVLTAIVMSVTMLPYPSLGGVLGRRSAIS